MPLVLSVEHASNQVPASLDLGIAADVFGTHVAWDEGAAVLAERLAAHTGSYLHRGAYTRLVADLNRSPENPEAVPATAFGVAVPGNACLDAAGRAARLALYHRPYWDQIFAAVAENIQSHGVCIHFAVHSFCPVYGTEPRDFDFGLLFDPSRPGEQRFADALAGGLSAHNYAVRENQPYTGTADSIIQNLRGRHPNDHYIGMALELSQRLAGAEPTLDHVAEVISRVLKNPEWLAAKPAPKGPGTR